MKSRGSSDLHISMAKKRILLTVAFLQTKIKKETGGMSINGQKNTAAVVSIFIAYQCLEKLLMMAGRSTRNETRRA